MQVTNKVIWGERDQYQVESYRRKCTELLRDIDFPEALSACCDKMCSNIEHRMVIDNFYNKIVNVLREAAEFSCAAPNIKKKKRYVAGWNKFVKGAHETARQAFLNRVWHGRSRAGRLYQYMCESRKFFKSKLKSCQKIRNE